MSETRIQIAVWHDGAPVLSSDATTASLHDGFEAAAATLDRARVAIEVASDQRDELVETEAQLDAAEKRLTAVRGRLDRAERLDKGMPLHDVLELQRQVLDSISMDVNGQEVEA